MKKEKESGYEPQSKFFHGLLLLQYLLGQDASSSQGYLPPWDVLWDFLESLLVITDTSGQRGHIVQVKRHSQKHNTVNDYYLNPHQDPSVQSLLH